MRKVRFTIIGFSVLLFFGDFSTVRGEIIFHPSQQAVRDYISLQLRGAPINLDGYCQRPDKIKQKLGTNPHCGNFKARITAAWNIAVPNLFDFECYGFCDTHYVENGNNQCVQVTDTSVNCAKVKKRIRDLARRYYDDIPNFVAQSKLVLAELANVPLPTSGGQRSLNSSTISTQATDELMRSGGFTAVISRKINKDSSPKVTESLGHLDTILPTNPTTQEQTFNQFKSNLAKSVNEAVSNLQTPGPNGRPLLPNDTTGNPDFDGLVGANSEPGIKRYSLILCALKEINAVLGAARKVKNTYSIQTVGGGSKNPVQPAGAGRGDR